MCNRRVFALLVALALPVWAFAARHEGTLVDALDIAVPAAPAVIRTDSGSRALYELHLTNFASQVLGIRRVVIRTEPAAAVASLGPSDLAGRTSVVGRSQGDVLQLEPGERAVIYLEVSVEGVPRALLHEVELQIPRRAEPYTVTQRSIVRSGEGDIPLAAPLDGGPWVAIHSPTWTRGHRRVFYAVDGRAILPGRFAVDWVLLGDGHRVATGDVDLAARYFGYGARVLAVADAKVASVRDGLPESARVSDNAAHSLDEAAGNYIALELADGRFVFYEHLLPGSISVRAGETVRRGQPIGRLGFTGDSTGPHLHFHVADAAEPLIGDGLPFAFEKFELLGRFKDAADIGTHPWIDLDAGTAGERRNEYPDSLTVVRF